MDAIPLLEAWLERENEYERIHALTGIVRADPSRRELLPEIWDSTQSVDPCVRETALEFYGLEDDLLLVDGTAFGESDDHDFD